MNYIHQMQAEVAKLHTRISNTRTAITAYRAYLNSPKFTGSDADGERKDWISTSEVLYLLDGILYLLDGIRIELNGKD